MFPSGNKKNGKYERFNRLAREPASLYAMKFWFATALTNLKYSP